MKKIFILFLFILASAFAADPKFTHESELGYIAAKGNSNQQTFNLSTRNSSPMGEFFLKFGGHYTSGYAENIQTIENWDLNVRLERKLSERFYLFLSEVVEANRFAGVEFRSKTEIGGGYKIIQGEKGTLDAEATIQYMYEKDIPDVTLNNMLVRLYGVYNYKFSENASFRWWAEYLPNLTTSADYFANTEASVLSNINSTFALKFSYMYKYRGLPPDDKLKWDQTTLMSVIAKI
jgi:putative salt-induced outer membrane protein